MTWLLMTSVWSSLPNWYNWYTQKKNHSPTFIWPTLTLADHSGMKLLICPNPKHTKTTQPEQMSHQWNNKENTDKKLKNTLNTTRKMKKRKEKIQPFWSFDQNVSDRTKACNNWQGRELVHTFDRNTPSMKHHSRTSKDSWCYHLTWIKHDFLVIDIIFLLDLNPSTVSSCEYCDTKW